MNKIILNLFFFILMFNHNAFSETPYEIFNRIEKQYCDTGGFVLNYSSRNLNEKSEFSGEIIFKKPFKMRVNCRTASNGKISFITKNGELILVTGENDIYVEIPGFASHTTRFGKIPLDYSEFQKKIMELIKRYDVKTKKGKFIWKNGLKKCELQYDDHFKLTVYTEKIKKKLIREIKFSKLLKKSPAEKNFNTVKKREFDLFY